MMLQIFFHENIIRDWVMLTVNLYGNAKIMDIISKWWVQYYFMGSFHEKLNQKGVKSGAQK